MREGNGRNEKEGNETNCVNYDYYNVSSNIKFGTLQLLV